MSVKTALCRTLPAVLTGSLLIAAPLCAQAAPFNIKPGAWEMVTSTMDNGAFVSPEAMAKLSPQQRADLEKHLKERAGQSTMRVMKICLTPDKLDQDAMIAFDQKNNCTQKVITKSAAKIQVERACPAPRAYSATLTMQAVNPDTVSSTNEVALPSGGKMHIEIKGKWLGASCEGIKQPGPAAQVPASGVAGH